MFPQLHTARFLLQELVVGDQAFVFEGLSHPRVIPFYGVRYESLEATAGQMDYYQRVWREGSGCYWKVVDKSTGQRLGVVGYSNHLPQHRRAEIGYWLLPAYWGQGIMAEVLAELLRYLHEEKQVHRVEALVEEGNTASDRVLERAGFVYEGTQRDCEIKEGQFISLRIYRHLP